MYDPAPGHSVMISSLASLFVAKAKATPEKVVPCKSCQQLEPLQGISAPRATHEIDTNNQLSLTPAVALDLGRAASLLKLRHRLALGRTRGRVTAAAASILRRSAHRMSLTTDGRKLRRVASDGSAGVDRRGAADHLRRRGARRSLSLVRHWACAAHGRTARRVVGRVARRAIAGAWVVHGSD